ncbi:MAG: hypothetical protein IMZ55_08695 [Acidobacteria bacterium]|nr:hypothetical protein [Acidobacteriota bacterium]
MLAWRLAAALVGVAVGWGVLAAPVRAARPTAEEMALRDRWVAEHFPSPAAGASTAAPTAPATAPPAAAVPRGEGGGLAGCHAFAPLAAAKACS